MTSKKVDKSSKILYNISMEANKIKQWLKDWVEVYKDDATVTVPTNAIGPEHGGNK